MQIKFVLLSLALHGVLFIYFFEDNNNKPAPVYVDIQYLEVPKNPVVLNPTSDIGKRRLKRQGQPRARKSDDDVLQGVLRNPIAELAAEASKTDELAFSDEGLVGGDQAFKAAVELPRPLEAIWRQIRGHIHYHSDFYIEELAGTVTADILLGEGGRLESLRNIGGHPLLVEWVKMALSEALRVEFLRQRLDKKILLHLKFRFQILPYQAPVQTYEYAQLNLNFNIFGYRPAGVGKATESDTYSGKKKMYRMSEWNFSKKIEPYRFACFVQKNPIGCERMIQYLTDAGLQKEARDAELFLKRLPASN